MTLVMAISEHLGDRRVAMRLVHLPNLKQFNMLSISDATIDDQLATPLKRVLFFLTYSNNVASLLLSYRLNVQL